MWDAEGELASDDDYQYVYDASGTRIVRDGADGTTVYLPGGQELTINGSAVSATRYYTFGGRTVATRTSNGLGGVTSLVSDRDGSVVAAVPNTTWTAGSLKRVYSDPFGAVRGNTDAGVPGDHRFLGAPRDAASGLTLLGARYYDPGVGCFISVDPVLNLTVPAHLHAYAYGFNNPVSFSDASGLEPRDRNGKFDGNPYGKRSSGGGGAGGGGGAATPPATSGAALAACAEISCNINWISNFGWNYYGGMAEVVGSVLWGSCSACMAGASLKGQILSFTDPDAYYAQKQAEAATFSQFWSDPWGNFWRPIGEDWANNPGHAFGATVAQAGLLVAPGGFATKASRLTETTAVSAARGGAAPVIQGQAGVNAFIAGLEQAGGRVLGREVSVKADGVMARPDLYVELPNGNVAFIEVKTGAGARLTPNQSSVYPLIRSGGATPVGANAESAGLAPGQPLGPVQVWEVRVPWPQN